MTDLISIIVPCYNSEMTIKKCINSIMNQTYKNFEIICIDDCSKDRTFKILNELNIDKVVLIHNKENKGVSFSRNLGILKAKGKYICFIDSDDTIDKNYLETLYVNILNYDADISITSLNGEIISDILKKEKYISEYLLSNAVGGYVWNKMYKKELIRNITFREDIVMSEDLVFNVEVAMSANKIVYIDKKLYFHAIDNNESLSKSYLSDKKLSSINSYNRIFDLLDEKYLYNYKIAMYKMLVRLKSENVNFIKEYTSIINNCIRERKLRKLVYCSKTINFCNKVKLLIFDYLWIIVALFRRRLSNEKK